MKQCKVCIKKSNVNVVWNLKSNVEELARNLNLNNPNHDFFRK